MRQMQADMTWELQTEVAQYGRSLSNVPLVPRQQAQSFARRVEEKLRRIYASITCTSVSDVVQHREAQRPPRHSVEERAPRRSTQQRPPRHSVEECAPRRSMEQPPSPDHAGGSGWHEEHISPPLRHGPRPRLSQQAPPRAPPPDQAGGSGWQQSQFTSDPWQQSQFNIDQLQQNQITFEQWQHQQPIPYMDFAYRPQSHPHGKRVPSYYC